MAGNVNVDITGDEKKYLQSLQRAIEGTAKLENRLGNLAEKSNQAGQAGSKAFGAGGGFEKIAGYAAGFLSTGAAIGFFANAIREADAAAVAAANRSTQSRKGIGALAQLAETPEEMQRLYDEVRKTVAEGGGGIGENATNEASSLVFELESAGALDQRKLFSQLRAKDLVEDPAEMVRAIQTMRSSMGEQETGSWRDMLGKMFVAGKISPGTAQAVGAAGAQTGALGQMLGMHDEELLGAVAVLSKVTGSAEEAATQIQAVLKAMAENQGFKGIGLMAGMEKIAGMKMDEATAVKWFGRTEGLKGFSGLMQNREVLAQAISEIQAAPSQDVVGKKMGLIDTLPEMQAVGAAGKAGNVKDLLETRDSQVEKLWQGAYDLRTAMLQAQGASPLDIGWSKTVMQVDRRFMPDEWMANKMLQGDRSILYPEGGGKPAGIDDTTLEQLRQASDALLVASENLKNSSLPKISPTLGGPNHDPGGK